MSGVPSNSVQIQGKGVVSADQLNTYVQTCTNVAALRTFIGTPNLQVDIQGYVSTADGGQGTFIWDPTASGDDGGITKVQPTGASSGAWVRVPSVAFIGAGVQQGACRLVFTNASTLTLKPYNGDLITVAGEPWSVPASGLTISNSGLTAGTIYYIYAHVVLGVLALAASTTGHSTDTSSGNVGVEIMTGNSLYSLVGMVQTWPNALAPHAGGDFVDDTSNRLVASWFNRRRRVSTYGNVLATASPTATALVALAFICWGDETVFINNVGSMRCVGGDGTSFSSSLGIDGSVSGTGTTSTMPLNAWANAGVYAAYAGLSEGSHVGNLFGQNASSQATSYAIGFFIDTNI